MSTPDDLRYTAEHEWARPTGEDTIRVGITHYAQESLGDIVFLSLPDVGAAITKGQPFGEIESTKSVSELYGPLDGTVRARNDALDQRPELVNTDPYGDGWMLEITIADTSALDSLMDAATYRATLDAD